MMIEYLAWVKKLNDGLLRATLKGILIRFSIFLASAVVFKRTPYCDRILMIGECTQGFPLPSIDNNQDQNKNHSTGQSGTDKVKQ